MERVRSAGAQLVAKASAGLRWLGGEARQIIDVDQFQTAATWRDRLDAVSWPRAGIAGGGLAAVAVAVGVVSWALQPDIRAHPPRLPTEAEWRAAQAADRAMEAELSPALAAANRSVPSGDAQ